MGKLIQNVELAAKFCIFQINLLQPTKVFLAPSSLNRYLYSNKFYCN